MQSPAIYGDLVSLKNDEVVITGEDFYRRCYHWEWCAAKSYPPGFLYYLLTYTGYYDPD